MTTPSEQEQPEHIDPMVAAGMTSEDVDAYWTTVTHPETFDHNDW